MSFAVIPHHLILHELHLEAERCPEAQEIPAVCHEAFVHAYAERRLLERLIDAENRIRHLTAELESLR